VASGIHSDTAKRVEELMSEVEDEKMLATCFAEHDAQHKEYTLLELQCARGPAWEWAPQGGVGDRGRWKHLVGDGDFFYGGGGGDGGGGGGGGG
jgi:hypothetical protein